MSGEFRNALGEAVFRQKYAQGPNDSWAALAKRVTDDVCGTFQGTAPAILAKDQLDYLEKTIREFKFLPGGRYLYYAGRKKHFWNNCFLLRVESDTREEWAGIVERSMSCLMSGGGIGIDYSVVRGKGAKLSQTGGTASGPVSLMKGINEIGRIVMQGGSRRSAIYASLNWRHADVREFLHAKDWANMPIGNRRKGNGQPYTLWDAKQEDFNFPAPLDMTNISLNYDNAFLEAIKDGTLPDIFVANVRQALSSAEPGFSFNFGSKENETLRNACTEVTSEDDSDVCNLGSINMANVETLDEFRDIVQSATRFLMCGTLRADVPYDKVKRIREKNRRLGLGLMGIHEWLLKRNYKYEVTPELKKWLAVYKEVSDATAREFADVFSVSRPVAVRAIAPTGTIGILAGTTTGIEPLFAVAYKRRYLKSGDKWHYQFVIDSTAEQLINDLGVKPDKIEAAATLAESPERRIAFQADVQDYVDMSISSTINLPAWGSKLNNEDKVESFAKTLAKYAPRLRGFTAYPDGCRGGQPITVVDYAEAKDHKGVEFQEHVECLGGVCGV